MTQCGSKIIKYIGCKKILNILLQKNVKDSKQIIISYYDKEFKTENQIRLFAIKIAELNYNDCFNMVHHITKEERGHRKPLSKHEDTVSYTIKMTKSLKALCVKYGANAVRFAIKQYFNKIENK